MPSLTELSKKISRRIQEKTGGQRPCVLCGEINWVVGEPVHLIVQNDPTTHKVTGVNYPLVVLVCANCGNTHLLNTRVLGLKESDLSYDLPPVREEKEEKGEKDGGE